MSGRRSLLAVVAGAVSAAVGMVLIGIGVITRQERAVSAGRRRFRGRAFDRRWISDPVERERHAEVVADRLSLPLPAGQLDLPDAAERLGISVATIRRRVRNGKLEGVYRGKRLVGVVLPSE
jgi:hypothetical protein